MAFLLAMHARLLFTISVLALLLALWGVISGLLRWPPARAWLAGLAIAQLLVLAEAIIGVALWAAGRQAAQPGLHLVYGIVTLLAIPVAWAYTRGTDARPQQLTLALACVFLVGVAMRAGATGGIGGG